MAYCFADNLTHFQIETSRIIGVISLVYSVLITTTNIILIVSMIATKQSLKHASNFLIICMSVSDTLNGVVLMAVLAVLNLWKTVPGSCLFLTTSMLLQWYFCGVSMSLTVLLALDRYLHMNPDFQTSPSKCSKLFTRPNIYITVSAVHLLTIALILTAYLLARYIPSAVVWADQTFLVLIFLFTSFFVVMYIRGYLRVRRFVVGNPIYKNREASNQNEGPSYLKELFKTVLILLVTVLVAWIPIFALSVACMVANFRVYLDVDLKFVFSKTAFLFFNLNAAINALVIFYRNQKSRDWFKKSFYSCFKQSGEQQTSNDDCDVISNTRAGENDGERRIQIDEDGH